VPELSVVLDPYEIASRVATQSFAACIRDHRLPTFPDPLMTDHDGQRLLGADQCDRPSPAYKRANQARRAILPLAATSPNAQAQSGETHLEASVHSLINQVNFQVGSWRQRTRSQPAC
jgi:hypothetical protein